MTAHSTREGSKGVSSRRETLFVGETSNSPINVEVDGAYICREEGCEDGKTSVDVAEWTASGAEEDVGKPLWDASGSRQRQT
jgi:hypothetical protein